MSWREFVPIEIIKAVSKHTIGACAAMIGFAVAGKLATSLFDDKIIETIIHWSEYIGIGAAMLYLLVIFIWELIKGTNAESRT